MSKEVLAKGDTGRSFCTKSELKSLVLSIKATSYFDPAGRIEWGQETVLTARKE
jgi:hypothetical protein